MALVRPSKRGRVVSSKGFALGQLSGRLTAHWAAAVAARPGYL
jgi:hypothetical protein